MLSCKIVELKLAVTVSIFSFYQLGNLRNLVSQRWIWPFRNFQSQVINRITEKKTERKRKQGVKAIILAAPWSSGKQRACFNIWWVSGLRPGNHNTLTHSGKKYLLLNPEWGDLTMLGPFLPCMQKCCVMFSTRNCLMWNMLINYNVTCSQLHKDICTHPWNVLSADVSNPWGHGWGSPAYAEGGCFLPPDCGWCLEAHNQSCDVKPKLIPKKWWWISSKKTFWLSWGVPLNVFVAAKCWWKWQSVSKHEVFLS